MRKSQWFVILSFPLIFAPILASSRIEAVRPSRDACNSEILAGHCLLASILTTTDRLVAEYGSRPPYSGQIFASGERLTPEQAIYALPYVIACESEDKSVKIVDSNGYYSYGIAQIQSSTWAGFVKDSGLGGDPMVKNDAVRMALWAFEHGYADLWSCARIEKVIHN